MKRLVLLVLALTGALCAVALPLEWMLLAGDARERLTEVLLRQERFDELAFLESVWEGDEWGAEFAARTLVDQTHDPSMVRWLAGYLRRTGREEEAERIAPRKQPRTLKASVPAMVAPDISSHRPVIFLHGYNGSAETWTDFATSFVKAGYKRDDLMIFSYGADPDGSGPPHDLLALGGDEDTPIESIAEQVVRNVREWLRWRIGPGDGTDPTAAEQPAPDWVCHSMGGLVFRHVLKMTPELVHRCVTLGTPHFGQTVGEISGIASLTGYQTEQMAHGSTFLWNLAADWHYHGHRTDDILFIVGAATTDKFLDIEDELVQDGLVNAVSATLLTRADGQAFTSRTFFVNRIHSSSLRILYEKEGYEGLVSLPKGVEDPVFKLAHGYLNDSGYFADGAVPNRDDVLAEDGMSPGNRGGVYRRLFEHGALFVQVMEPETNTVSRLQNPVEYSSGSWYRPPDNVIEWFQVHDGRYEDRSDGLIRANGSGDEGCGKGLVLLYGDIPTGKVAVVVGKPYGYDGRHGFPYADVATIYGGGTTIWRTRPDAAKPMSAVEVADGLGTSRTLAVSNSWLEAAGLVTSAEDLAGCMKAAAAAGANGYPAALSALLGLDPSDPGSTVRFDGVGVGETTVDLSLRMGDRLLPPDAPFALQGKPALSDAWRGLDDVARMPGLWTVPRDAGCFFRAVLKW